jgi:5-methylcytosine-specific restriction endonuclease McrA
MGRERLICEVCNIVMVVPDTHHIHSRCYGGPNDKGNICTLCPNCHRKVHNGEIILEGKFGTTKGKRLVWRKKDEMTITGHQPRCWLYSDNKDNSDE